MPQDARTASTNPSTPLRWSKLLLSRTAGILAAVISLGIILGCMSIGETHTEVIRTEPSEPETPHALPPGDGLLVQTGKLHIAGNASEDVYYPIPYISPPNVTIRTHMDFASDVSATLVTQRSDHFRIHNNSSHECSIEWNANGIKMLLSPLPQPPAPPEVPQGLPTLPVPIEPQPKP